MSWFSTPATNHLSPVTVVTANCYQNIYPPQTHVSLSPQPIDHFGFLDFHLFWISQFSALIIRPDTVEWNGLHNFNLTNLSPEIRPHFFTSPPGTKLVWSRWVPDIFQLDSSDILNSCWLTHELVFLKKCIFQKRIFQECIFQSVFLKTVFVESIHFRNVLFN